MARTALDRLKPRAVVDLFARTAPWPTMRLEMRIGTRGTEIARAAAHAAMTPGLTVTLDEKPRTGEFNLEVSGQDGTAVTAAGRRARNAAKTMIREVGYATVGRVVTKR